MKTGTDKPHWQGHRERLRGKLLARGASALDDYEILEVLLMAFIPRRDVKPIAKALEANGSAALSGVLAAPMLRDLVKVDADRRNRAAAYLKAVERAAKAAASLQEIRKREVISSWNRPCWPMSAASCSMRRASSSALLFLGPEEPTDRR
jgi:DNA repair protein RadC